jgi:hypothetical protein
MKSNHPTEPAHFGIPRGRIDAFLGERGYLLTEYLGALDMEAKYLSLRNSTVIGKVPTVFSLVHAVVVKQTTGV